MVKCVVFMCLQGDRNDNMIQDMINSDNMNSTESTIPNIFKTIKEQYGASTLSKCRKHEKTQLKHARYTNHLRFSLRCLHNNLIPNDLYLKPKMQDPKSRKILDKASLLLLYRTGSMGTTTLEKLYNHP